MLKFHHSFTTILFLCYFNRQVIGQHLSEVSFEIAPMVESQKLSIFLNLKFGNIFFSHCCCSQNTFYPVTKNFHKLSFARLGAYTLQLQLQLHLHHNYISFTLLLLLFTYFTTTTASTPQL